MDATDQITAGELREEIAQHSEDLRRARVYGHRGLAASLRRRIDDLTAELTELESA